MATATRLAAVALASCVGVQGIRVVRLHADKQAPTKSIGGVPVLNYHLAYKGQESLSRSALLERTQDWILGVDKETTDEEVHRLCQLGNCLHEGHPSEGGVPFFEVSGTEADLEQLLEQAGGVKVNYIEPDGMAHAIPEFDGQPEAEDSEPGVMAATWGLRKIKADTRTSNGRGTHIYVFDTGIRRTHREFGGRVVPTVDMTLGSGFECSSLNCAQDRDGHGTHCAGTAAGATYGVAPGAVVHAVKTLDDAGSGPWSWDYTALDFVATKGARPAVVSMSLGGPGTMWAMRDAVDATVAAGVTVVVAGGNESDDACKYAPAFVPSAITVGSIDSDNRVSMFSNWGECTTMWAPGGEVLSAAHTGDEDAISESGTSMACPHVSGAAALLLQRTPSMQPAKVRENLLRTAVTGVIRGLQRTDTDKLLQVSGF